MRFLIFQLYVIGIIVIGYLVKADQITFDPGIGWHLKTGQYVVEKLEIPRVDPFLASKKAWVSDQWLTDSFLYGIYSLGSWQLLAAFVPIFFSLVFFGLLYGLLREFCQSHVFSLCGTTLAFFICLVQFLARPVVFSFLFFVLTLGFILRLYKEGNNTLSAKRAAVIASMFVLWANIHPSFILGFLLFFAAAAGQVVQKVFNKVDGNFKLWNWLSFLAVAFLATLLNPYFFELHQSVVQLGSSEYFMNLHTEWQPFEYEGAFGVIVVFLLVTAVADLTSDKKLLHRENLFLFLGMMGFLHLGLTSVRMISYFAITACLPAARLLTTLPWERFPVLRVLPIIDKKETPTWVNYPAIMFIALMFPTNAFVSGTLPLTNLSAMPDKETYPYEELEVVNAVARSTTENINLLATSNYGGFLIFYSEGNVYPVIDDRNTLNGEESYKKLIEGFSSGESMMSFAQETNSHFLILDKNLTASKELIKEAEVCLETEKHYLFRVGDTPCL